MTSRIEPQGDVAARIVYTLTNNNPDPVTVSAGVWADIMIGDNDDAPLACLSHEGYVYGLKLQYAVDDQKLMCALWGEGITGVVDPADDYWFGQYRNNYLPAEIVGVYDNIHEAEYVNFWGQHYFESEEDPYYLHQNGDYDSGMGFCWKGRTIEAHGSIELSYLISVGEVDYVAPFVPGDDRFEYQVEAYNFDEWNDLTVAHPAHVWGYYEHPYGQEGYIEYRVDGARDWTGEWTRIPTPLVSGEDFELPFDMFFNPDETELHKLELRFNDGLDNIVAMDGLQWEDVRSIPLTVSPETQAYDGTPKLFVVTVGGVIDYTVGENGEYVEPGQYEQGIWGVYEMETIGINTVYFYVDKGQSMINATVSADCVYDGEPHAATVELVQGDGAMTVTYVNTATNETSTEAPVLPGTYTVVVTVAETDHYYGLEETVGTFTIDKAQSVVDVVIPGNVEHDGQAHGATVTLLVGDTEPVVTYYLVGENEVLEPIVGLPIEEGVYVVVVTVPESQLYYGTEGTYGPYQIYIPTAINELNMDTEANGAWYTIQGVRVSAPTAPGVYIHNGKKYIVK